MMTDRMPRIENVPHVVHMHDHFQDKSPTILETDNRPRAEAAARDFLEAHPMGKTLILMNHPWLSTRTWLGHESAALVGQANLKRWRSQGLVA